ncbi:MAG: hypothetical protein ABI718_15975 [Acidobacteriota bacterium]
MGDDFYPHQAFHVTEMSVYAVIGVSFDVTSRLYGKTVLFEIADDYRRLATVPAVMFEIADGTPSKLWSGRLWEDGSFALWPSSLFSTYYHEDLSDGVKAVVDDFAKVLAAIEKEAFDLLVTEGDE